MKTKAWLIILLFNIISNANTTRDSQKTYNGYKVLSISKLHNKHEVNALENLQRRMRNLDFWSDPNLLRKTQIMVPPQAVRGVKSYLTSHGLKYTEMIPNVEEVIQKERKGLRTGRQNGAMNWKNYQKLNTIYSWLDSLSFQNPNGVQVLSLGKSFENRDIKLVKISTGGYKRKPIIYIDAGIHAREWIAPATATYMMNELLKTSFEERDLLQEIDWYFVPVLNPDGYEYTYTEDRLWRKTRSTHNGADCIGVDANRNFDFHWGEVGVKKEDPCHNTYPGPHPFSEPETNATAKFLYTHRSRIRAYITLHSYSQLILTPFGYSDELPEDYDEMKELGERAAKAIENVHGTEYEVGAPSEILYKNAGSSRDWAKGVADIKYPFTIELPDKGDKGFLLPAEEIKPTAEETWQGIKIIARQIIKEFPF